MNIDSLTEKIIGCAYEVSNELGSGFLEKVYEKALIVELSNVGLKVEAQKEIKVLYKGYDIGNYYPDIIVEDQVIIELKIIKQIERIHLGQVMNYLKACKLQYGLILNFGNPKVEVKRVIFSR